MCILLRQPSLPCGSFCELPFPESHVVCSFIPFPSLLTYARPEMSSVFPLWANATQPSRVLPIHFLGNVLTIFLLRREGKISLMGETGQCVIFLGWKKGRSRAGAMRGPADVQMGGVVRQNNGQLLPTTPPHRAWGQSQSWSVTEAKSSHSLVTTRGQLFPDTK